MPLLALLLALIAPRIVLLLVALFTDIVARAYEGWLVPLLGWIFLPMTTLVYALAVHVAGGVDGGLWLVLMVLAVLFDLGATGWKVRGRRRG